MTTPHPHGTVQKARWNPPLGRPHHLRSYSCPLDGWGGICNNCVHLQSSVHTAAVGIQYSLSGTHKESKLETSLTLTPAIAYVTIAVTMYNLQEEAELRWGCFILR